MWSVNCLAAALPLRATPLPTARSQSSSSQWGNPFVSFFRRVVVVVTAAQQQLQQSAAAAYRLPPRWAATVLGCVVVACNTNSFGSCAWYKVTWRTDWRTDGRTTSGKKLPAHIVEFVVFMHASLVVSYFARFSKGGLHPPPPATRTGAHCLCYAAALSGGINTFRISG